MAARKVAAKPSAPARTKRALPQGRPPKRSDARMTIVLKGLRAGLSYEQCAKYAGVTDRTILNWRQDTKTDFGEQCEKARAEMEMAMLVRIENASLDPKNWGAAAWKLERIFPERYGRQRVELTGVNGGPIATKDVTLDQKLERLTDDELRALARERMGDADRSEGVAGGP